MTDNSDDLAAQLEKLKQEYQETYGVSWDDDRRFYALIGQGISFWSLMETELVRITARLLEASDTRTGVLMYSIMSPGTWLQIIDDLFLLTPSYSAYRVAYNEQATIIRKWIDVRNRLAHHTTIDGAKRTSVNLLRPELDNRSKSLAQKPLFEDEIYAFTRSIHEVCKALRSVLETIPVKLPPDQKAAETFPETSSGPANDPRLKDGSQ